MNIVGGKNFDVLNNKKISLSTHNETCGYELKSISSNSNPIYINMIKCKLLECSYEYINRCFPNSLTWTQKVIYYALTIDMDLEEETPIVETKPFAESSSKLGKNYF